MFYLYLYIYIHISVYGTENNSSGRTRFHFGRQTIRQKDSQKSTQQRLRAPQPFKVFAHRVRDGHELSILPRQSGRDKSSFRGCKQEWEKNQELMEEQLFVNRNIL